MKRSPAYAASALLFLAASAALDVAGFEELLDSAVETRCWGQIKKALSR